MLINYKDNSITITEKYYSSLENKEKNGLYQRIGGVYFSKL